MNANGVKARGKSLKPAPSENAVPFVLEDSSWVNPARVRPRPTFTNPRFARSGSNRATAPRKLKSRCWERASSAATHPVLDPDSESRSGTYASDRSQAQSRTGARGAAAVPKLVRADGKANLRPHTKAMTFLCDQRRRKRSRGEHDSQQCGVEAHEAVRSQSTEQPAMPRGAVRRCSALWKYRRQKAQAGLILPWRLFMPWRDRHRSDTDDVRQADRWETRYSLRHRQRPQR